MRQNNPLCEHLWECTFMVTKAQHTVTVEPLEKDRFALVVGGLVRFVSYDFNVCVRRAEMIQRSTMSTRAKDDQALQVAILR
jgi:hypothetical protein